MSIEDSNAPADLIQVEFTSEFKRNVRQMEKKLRPR